MTGEQSPLLQVSHLCKYFSASGGTVKAVDDVSFTIYRGETLGMVGESGCGKTTCGRTAMGLYDKTSGEVLFDGIDVHTLRGAKKREFSRRAQIIFQDPYASLDPRMTVADIIAEGLDIHGLCRSKAERAARVYELLEMVGLNREHANRFAHEFSGGQRQRIMIARALILNPEFVVCDEPVSALDVSVRAQVLNLMRDLQRDMSLTYMFISHDLSVVRYVCDRIMVMYLGQVMEIATKDELYARAQHPYTQALLSSIPIPDVDVQPDRIRLSGELPSPFNPPVGCRFNTRCRFATEKCRTCQPQLQDVGNGHIVACHLCEP